MKKLYGDLMGTLGPEGIHPQINRPMWNGMHANG